MVDVTGLRTGSGVSPGGRRELVVAVVAAFSLPPQPASASATTAVQTRAILPVTCGVACRGAIRASVSESMRSRRSRRSRRSWRGEQELASLNGLRHCGLTRGVNPVLYWTTRAIFVPFFLIYFRMQRIGTAHIPRHEALLLASNHRSFLDPFVIGTLVRRPVYYMVGVRQHRIMLVDRHRIL